MYRMQLALAYVSPDVFSRQLPSLPARAAPGSSHRDERVGFGNIISWLNRAVFG